MSELQNRIIQRVSQTGVAVGSGVPYARHASFLAAAFELFRAAGGHPEDALQVLNSHEPAQFDVASAVAHLLVETAIVSQVSDLDMVQAAYNWIDHVND